MSNPNVTLRVSGSLRHHLEERTGEYGLYETPSEYLRDLIRKDMERIETEKWERLRTALAEGLSVKESDYQSISAAEVKKRAQKRHGLA